MVLPGYFRKLMGWCPMKNSLGKRKQENNYPDVKLENGSIQLEPYPADPHESRILKVQVSLFDGEWVLWALIITFAALIVSLLLWTYSPEGSCLIIFSGLIMFLVPLVFLLNRPNAATVRPGTIIIKKPMRKPFVIENEDIMQISVTRNENRSLRWLVRLIYIVFISLYFAKEIMTTLWDLERSVPDYVNLSIFLMNLAVVTLFLVLFYNFELLASYQRALKVSTHSNLKLCLYTEEPEELTKFLKNEKE